MVAADEWMIRVDSGVPFGEGERDSFLLTLSLFSSTFRTSSTSSNFSRFLSLAFFFSRSFFRSFFSLFFSYGVPGGEESREVVRNENIRGV